MILHIRANICYNMLILNILVAGDGFHGSDKGVVYSRGSS